MADFCLENKKMIKAEDITALSSRVIKKCLDLG